MRLKSIAELLNVSHQKVRNAYAALSFTAHPIRCKNINSEGIERLKQQMLSDDPARTNTLVTVETGVHYKAFYRAKKNLNITTPYTKLTDIQKKIIAYEACKNRQYIGLYVLHGMLTARGERVPNIEALRILLCKNIQLLPKSKAVKGTYKIHKDDVDTFITIIRQSCNRANNLMTIYEFQNKIKSENVKQDCYGYNIISKIMKANKEVLSKSTSSKIHKDDIETLKMLMSQHKNKPRRVYEKR